MLTEHPGGVQVLKLVYVHLAIQCQGNSQSNGEKKEAEQHQKKKTPAGCNIVAHRIAIYLYSAALTLDDSAKLQDGFEYDELFTIKRCLQVLLA